MNGMPATGSRALGTWAVSGHTLVPRPPTSSTACRTVHLPIPR